MNAKLNPGDNVMVLSEYNLLRGTVKSIGPKNIKVSFPAQRGFISYEKAVNPEKVAHVEESIAVICERWRGKNGRGGYRLERDLYPNLRLPAGKWPYQALVNEVDYGIPNPKNPTHLLPECKTPIFDIFSNGPT